jgi:hypothetical protein
MDAMGEIEIKLEGSVGKEKLRPEHVDIYCYSESYLDKLLKKAAPAWEAVTDADAWLDDLRDNTHA